MKPFKAGRWRLVKDDSGDNPDIWWLEFAPCWNGYLLHDADLRHIQRLCERALKYRKGKAGRGRK